MLQYVSQNYTFFEAACPRVYKGVCRLGRQSLDLLDDAPAGLDGGVVEDVFEGEEESCGEDRLGDLGRDA